MNTKGLSNCNCILEAINMIWNLFIGGSDIGLNISIKTNHKTLRSVLSGFSQTVCCCFEMIRRTPDWAGSMKRRERVRANVEDEPMLRCRHASSHLGLIVHGQSRRGSGAQELKYAAFLSGSIVGGLMVHCHWSKAQKDLEESCFNLSARETSSPSSRMGKIYIVMLG